MAKNTKRSLLDPNQIVVNQYDEDHDAQRVIVLNASDFPQSTITKEITHNEKSFELKRIEIPIPIKETSVIDLSKAVYWIIGISILQSIQIGLLIWKLF
jgi:hypothetical protein